MADGLPIPPPPSLVGPSPYTAHARVLRGDPAEIIANSARETGTSLIVFATHRKSGMKAFWAGSVAHRVCSQCQVPMLLLPILEPAAS